MLKWIVRVHLLGALIAGFLLLSSCTKRPSQEELSTLEQAERAAAAAEQQVHLLESELSQLQTELEREKQTLLETISELDAVKQKLGQ